MTRAVVYSEDTLMTEDGFRIPASAIPSDTAIDASVVLSDAVNISFNATTGTKLGTATTQKMGFYNATPVVQPAGTVDVLASLVTLGLRAASSNPPLNLGSGALTAGAASVAALTATSIAATGTVALTGTLTVSDAVNVVLNATTGSQIGTAVGQKLGFHGSAAVAQRAGAAQAAVAGTAATAVTPYGYAQAQADAIVTLLNEIRATLVEKGLMKGAA